MSYTLRMYKEKGFIQVELSCSQYVILWRDLIEICIKTMKVRSPFILVAMFSVQMESKRTVLIWHMNNYFITYFRLNHDVLLKLTKLFFCIFFWLTLTTCLKLQP